MDKQRRSSFVGGEFQARLAYGVEVRISIGVGYEGVQAGLALLVGPAA